MAGKNTSRRKHQPSFTPKYRRLKKKVGHDLAFVEANGRRHYLGRYNTRQSREQYHRFVAEWEACGRVAPVRPEEVTVVEVAAQFMRWARGYYIKHGRPTSEPGNIVLALRPLKELYGRTKAVDFGPRALKAVRQKMVDRGWTRKYINKHVDRIKRMFKWAVAEELVPPKVYQGLRAVAGLKFGRCSAPDRAPIQPAPVELIEPVKRHVSRQVAAMINLQLLTGARPGEIVIMRPRDLDRDGPVWVYRPAEHKTEHHGHGRVIFVGPKAQEIIQPFLLRVQDAYCFSPAEAEAERRRELHLDRTTPITQGNAPGTNRRDKPIHSPGDRYTSGSYRRAIGRGLERAFPPPGDLAKRDDETWAGYQSRLTKDQEVELKRWRRAHHWHPHQLRHNYATYVRKEFGLEAAQILLGHSKADVTQVYAERDMNRATAVAAKIG